MTAATTANFEPTEMRFCVDVDEAPLYYPEGHLDAENLAVEVAGPSVLATLVLPIEKAREWAGELFGAVSVASRELTGDPHALADYEIAGLTKVGYDLPLASTSAATSARRHGCASRSRSTSVASRSAPGGCGCDRGGAAGELADRPHRRLRRAAHHRDRDRLKLARETSFQPWMPTVCDKGRFATKDGS